MKGIAVRDQRQPGWGWFNSAVVDQYGPLIKADGLAIYMALAKYANNTTQTARPGVPTLAAHTGLSERQVRRVLDRLEGYHLIRIDPRIDPDGRQTTNEYTLLPVRPWAVAAGEGDCESGGVDCVTTPPDSQSRGGDSLAGGRVTVSQGEGDCESPELDSVELDLSELDDPVGEVEGTLVTDAPPPPPPEVPPVGHPTETPPPALVAWVVQRYLELYPPRAPTTPTAMRERIEYDLGRLWEANGRFTRRGIDHAFREAAGKSDPWEYAFHVLQAKPDGPPKDERPAGTSPPAAGAPGLARPPEPRGARGPIPPDPPPVVLRRLLVNHHLARGWGAPPPTLLEALLAAHPEPVEAAARVVRLLGAAQDWADIANFLAAGVGAPVKVAPVPG